MLTSMPSVVCNALCRTPPTHQCPKHAISGALLHSRLSKETLACINECHPMRSAYPPNIPRDGFKCLPTLPVVHGTTTRRPTRPSSAQSVTAKIGPGLSTLSLSSSQ